uniref:Uncharacterized protein n=1 Tax=Ditylenchus dipsaci TaxID=166011 RepID=A0A915EML0_9BILA
MQPVVRVPLVLTAAQAQETRLFVSNWQAENVSEDLPQLRDWRRFKNNRPWARRFTPEEVRQAYIDYTP